MNNFKNKINKNSNIDNIPTNEKSQESDKDPWIEISKKLILKNDDINNKSDISRMKLAIENKINEIKK